MGQFFFYGVIAANTVLDSMFLNDVPKCWRKTRCFISVLVRVRH